MRRLLPLSTLLILALLQLVTPPAHGWGRHGHAIISQSAAAVASQEKKGEFLKTHSFDLGYYSNVPDLVWKKPATYDIEWTNHFMDMEIFDRELKGTDRRAAFELDRLAFNSTYPAIPDTAGRAWWRIRELAAELERTSIELKKTDLPTEKRHQLQVSWLVLAGVIGHYVADLSQPLHVTENYDGQLTGQKGIHGHYEEAIVDQLTPDLEVETTKLARSKWVSFKKKNEKKPLLTLLEELSLRSNADLARVLKIDKKIGRGRDKKATAAYRRMIVEQMTEGSLVLAELWRRQLGWDYDGNKFYLFEGMPAYVYPPKAAPSPTPKKD